MTIIFLIIGLIGSPLIAFIGYHFKDISASGVPATIFTGTTIAVTGDFSTWSVVIFLFCSSFVISLWKKIFFPQIIHIEKIRHSKSSARDALQICANLLPATICLLLFHTSKDNRFLVGYLASITGATADT